MNVCFLHAMKVVEEGIKKLDHSMQHLRTLLSSLSRCTIKITGSDGTFDYLVRAFNLLEAITKELLPAIKCKLHAANAQANEKQGDHKGNPCATWMSNDTQVDGAASNRDNGRWLCGGNQQKALVHSMQCTGKLLKEIQEHIVGISGLIYQ